MGLRIPSFLVIIRSTTRAYVLCPTSIVIITLIPAWIVYRRIHQLRIPD